MVTNGLNELVLTILLVCSILLNLSVSPSAHAQEFLPLMKWGRYGSADGRLDQPNSIALTPSGNILVADTGNNRVQMFSSNGTFITNWGGYGRGDGQLIQPHGVTVTPSGNILVADTGNNRVQMFSSNGTFITKWGRYGSADGRLDQPNSIALTPSGNILVSDTGNNRVQMFSSNGTFITNWGRYGRGDGQLIQPHGVTVTPSGNILVADTGNNRVQMFSSNGTFITNWGRYGRGDGQFKWPEGIALTPSGNILVSDTGNNRVLGFNLEYITRADPLDTDAKIIINDPRLETNVIAEGLEFPTAMAFLGPNDILVLERLTGTVKRIVDGNTLDKPLLNISDYKIGSCMCGTAIGKQGNATYVFIYIAELQLEANKIVDRLYRYELVNNNTKLTNPEILLDLSVRNLQAIHHGGKVMLGPDNNIYVIIGDIDGRNTKAQNIKDGPDPDGSSSILRMTFDGKPIEGDSILGNINPLNKYYAYGIRNSFGFDFDPVTGKIWFTDNGPSFGDEINLAEPGFNGGWKKVMGMSSLKKTFNETSLANFEGKGKYGDPQFEWVESIGPTALRFLNSEKLGKQYENDMFIGDINNGNLYHFKLNQTRTGLSLNGSLSDKIAENIPERDQSLFAHGFGGITDLQIGPDGYLYVVSAQGQIYAIKPSQ